MAALCPWFDELEAWSILEVRVLRKRSKGVLEEDPNKYSTEWSEGTNQINNKTRPRSRPMYAVY